LLGVNDRAGELAEQVVEPLALLDAERGVVVPHREHGQRFGIEESQRLDDLLGQLAGTVIYSQQDLLLPPHVVAAGETLQSIAGPLGVPWQLLAKINGIDDPSRLVPGEQLKVLRGPFDAVVSVARGRLSLQVGGNYAGSFPVVVGRQVRDRIGASLAVVDVRRGAAGGGAGPTAQVAYLAAAGGKSIALGDGLSIDAADDPAQIADRAPSTSLVVAAGDLDEIIDILGPGSHVLVRK
ncbi:LysM peptidoglycan-binding domain-containing protein, partial [bacterium]|nr:LysM peptidoglycan-binding domain-containing protein [bacterium]